MGRRRLTEEERRASKERRREINAERTRRLRKDPAYREKERRRDAVARRVARKGTNEAVKQQEGHPVLTSSFHHHQGMNNAIKFNTSSEVPAVPKILMIPRTSQASSPSALNSYILKMVQPRNVPNKVPIARLRPNRTPVMIPPCSVSIKVPIPRLRPKRTPPVSSTPRPMFLFKAASDPVAPESAEQQILGLPSAMDDASCKKSQPEKGCKSQMEPEKDLPSFVKLQCKSICIGSYNVMAPDPNHPVLIENSQITITVPPIGDDSHLVVLQLSIEDITQVLVSPEKHMPVIFIYLTTKCAKVIRECLNMRDSSKGYLLDPSSREESQRMITLFPSSIEKEQHQFLRSSCSFSKKVSEVSPQVADPS